MVGRQRMTAVDRVAAREGQDDIDRPGVVAMHEASRVLDDWQAHIAQTDHVEPPALAEAITALRQTGDLRL